MDAAQLAGRKGGDLRNFCSMRFWIGSSAAEGLRQFVCTYWHEPPENRQTVVRNAGRLTRNRDGSQRFAAIVVDHRGDAPQPDQGFFIIDRIALLPDIVERFAELPGPHDRFRRQPGHAFAPNDPEDILFRIGREQSLAEPRSDHRDPTTDLGHGSWDFPAFDPG